MPRKWCRSPKFPHGELRVEARGDVLQKGRRGSSEDDVVDVEKQVGDTITVFVNKEGCVGRQSHEAELTNVRGESLVPSAWCLLQTVQRPL
jgi:hypothetical protein